jgi:hypothetical protein
VSTPPRPNASALAAVQTGRRGCPSPNPWHPGQVLVLTHLEQEVFDRQRHRASPSFH